MQVYKETTSEVPFTQTLQKFLRMLLDKHGEDRAWHVEELNKYMGIRGNKRKSFLKDRSKLSLFFKS